MNPPPSHTPCDLGVIGVPTACNPCVMCAPSVRVLFWGGKEKGGKRRRGGGSFSFDLGERVLVNIILPLSLLVPQRDCCPSSVLPLS